MQTKIDIVFIALDFNLKSEFYYKNISTCLVDRGDNYF